MKVRSKSLENLAYVKIFQEEEKIICEEENFNKNFLRRRKQSKQMKLIILSLQCTHYSDRTNNSTGKFSFKVVFALFISIASIILRSK